MSEFDITKECQCDGLLDEYKEKSDKYDKAFSDFKYCEEEYLEYYRKEDFWKAYEMVFSNDNSFTGHDYNLSSSYRGFLIEQFASSKKKMDDAKKEFDDFALLLEGCETDYVVCDKCDEPFSKNVWSCIVQCEGCGRWYCRSCYDPELEELEKEIGPL